ncbi:MAG: hypothetical protein K9N07_11510 [Candidatus Cloacimonetes bacterium]|nr:hypothetical protein [Candidatus Cloacimonadota bacterium]
MSEMGIYNSRFFANDQSLRNFNEAIKNLYKKEFTKRIAQKWYPKLMQVILPLSTRINDNFSKENNINEDNILSKLKISFRIKYKKSWSEYSTQILEIKSKLDKDTALNEKDFEILNDVADALDDECANLFEKIRGLQ